MTKKKAAAEITHTAADNAAALLNDAKDRLGPLASEAKSRSAEYAHQAADAVAPALAAAKVAAKDRYDEFLPKVTEALEQLANNPNAQEAQSRGVAALKALRGDLQLSKKERKKLHKESLAQIQALKDTGAPQPKKKKKLLTFLLLGGLGVVAYLAWKKFFGPEETDWQSHTASAYQAPSAPSTQPTAAPETPKYGEGAYVGPTPPEEFTIKGNERSKKYHTPGTGGYERTIADVWFVSEEAAEAAGFAKAQR